MLEMSWIECTVSTGWSEITCAKAGINAYSSTDIQTDRQTDRQREREREREN